MTERDLSLFPRNEAGPRRAVRSNSYHMLICSLPALPPRFDAAQLPISREGLKGRMRMLEPEDAQEIGRMLDVLKWSSQFAEAKDSAVVRRFGELMQQIANPLVREVLAAGMDIRMVLAALRRRRQGSGPPTVGFGRWFDRIRQHFDAPDFRLGRVLPWLVPFDQLLERGDMLTLYRRVLGEAWTYMRKRAQEYDTFSFEAVALYISGWDILRSWQQLQAARGRAVFETLVTEAMGEYAELHF
jgi:hypothetical protein